MNESGNMSIIRLSISRMENGSEMLVTIGCVVGNMGIVVNKSILNFWERTCFQNPRFAGYVGVEE